MACHYKGAEQTTMTFLGLQFQPAHVFSNYDSIYPNHKKWQISKKKNMTNTLTTTQTKVGLGQYGRKISYYETTLETSAISMGPISTKIHLINELIQFIVHTQYQNISKSLLIPHCEFIIGIFIPKPTTIKIYKHQLITSVHSTPLVHAYP